MRLHTMRYSLIFILIHWLLTAASVTLLGLGWYLRTAPTTTTLHYQLVTLHVSLGLTTAILIALALLLRLFFGTPPYAEGIASWRRLASGATHVFLYVSLVALIASGYLHEAFSATPMEFWGWPLPIWGESDEDLAQRLLQAHQISGYAFAGVVIIHLALLVANSVKQPGFFQRMLPVRTMAGEEALLREAQQPVVGAKIVQRLATRLRLLGWLQFWLQFVLAFLSALLLQFATSGRIFSSLSLGFGEAMYWGGVALGLLGLTCGLAFGYTRLGRRLELFPERYLAGSNRGFWRVNAGFALSLLGVAIAFIGVALSIVILVAKTVSQPPGIAITDPNKIIRALDIFVLLMNFMLLIAHSFGLGSSLWLGVESKRARSACREAEPRRPEALPVAVEPPPPETSAS